MLYLFTTCSSEKEINCSGFVRLSYSFWWYRYSSFRLVHIILFWRYVSTYNHFLTHKCGDLSVHWEMDLIRTLSFCNMAKYLFQYHVQRNRVTDWPRFKHRGFLIDTARHFINLKFILQFIVSRLLCLLPCENKCP